MADRAYLVDESRWPLVRITVPVHDPDMPEFERYLGTLARLLARRQPYVIVVDARAGGSIPVQQRERLRQYRRQVFGEAQRYQRGIAFVVESAIQRAVLSSLLWLAPEPSPSKVFSSVLEAEAWAESCLPRSHAA
jgi:hypothetical protein